MSRAAFIEPCLPSPADHPLSDSNWIHEIKHDGYRLMARRDPVDIRLITRRGNDWTTRFPLVVEAVNHLKVRSCLIDGEVVCCDERGLAIFSTLRQRAERGARLPVRLRSVGAGRPRYEVRANRDPQGHAGKHLEKEPSGSAPE
jgi:ATP-dependent DNA ligase